MSAETPDDPKRADSHPEIQQNVTPEVEEEMPEFEELTPELMEDECLRGDTMLRWALIMLAMLLGWTVITESGILVQIRSGEYMLSHGILPPGGDPFSASAEGREWINLSWLSDILLAIVHKAAGMSGLTVFCALTVLATFVVLSRINVSGVSTWWGSFCGLIALVALFPMFQPGSSTITMLGLSLLFLCLTRDSQSPQGAEENGTSSRFPWAFAEIPILFFLWVNLDARAWVGLLLLVLFVIGDSIARKIHGRPQSKRNWGVVLITVMVADLLVPWSFQPLIGFRSMFLEQGAMQTYGILSEFFPRLAYGLKDSNFWILLDIYAIASLTLLTLSLVTMILNVKRLNPGWAFVWAGINGISLFDGDFVCYAALGNAVIATLNGQEWYRSCFSMTYSVDTWSVLWGRGGRAVMVLSYLGIAYLAINGAFMGPQGRRLGLGLDPRWTNRIESLKSSIVGRTFSDRIFPTIAAQGDLLIWLGQKPFIDSRVGLYISGNRNLLETHREIRNSLFAINISDATANQDYWKTTLSSFKVFDVLVRLWTPGTPYTPFLQMVGNQSFAMTGFGAAGANFTRVDLDNEELVKHAREFSATQFALQAFRPEKKPKITRLEGIWPIPVSSYDRWLIQKRQVVPNDVELASHYEQLLAVAGSQLPLDQVAGLALLAIRDCRATLENDPNQASAYRVLAQAYSVLEQVENRISQGMGVPPGPNILETQTLGAVSAAVIAGQGNPYDLQLLLDLFLESQHLDAALNTLERLEAAYAKFPSINVTSERKEQLQKLKEDLKKAVDQTRSQVQQARSGSTDRAQLVAYAIQGRCPLLALSILDEDRTEIERSPELKLLYGSLQIQVGQFDTAVRVLESLDSMLSPPNPNPQMQPIIAQWRSLTASANLGTLDLHRAIDLWGGEDQSYIKQGVQSLLQMPFASNGLPVQYEIWPAYYARMGISAAVEIPERIGRMELQSAVAELQLGQLDRATARLEHLLKTNPHCSQRFVAAFYLTLLTGKNVEVIPMPSAPDRADPNRAEETTPETQASSSGEAPVNNPAAGTPQSGESTTAEPVSGQPEAGAPAMTPPTTAPPKPAPEAKEDDKPEQEPSGTSPGTEPTSPPTQPEPQSDAS